MADREGNSGVGGIVAGVAAVAVVIGGLAYFFAGPDSLKKVVTEQEFEAIKQEEKKEDRKVLSDLEKKYGPDHPQVQQMKMELGDVPFPDGNK